jgi:hypothetical protein
VQTLPRAASAIRRSPGKALLAASIALLIIIAAVFASHTSLFADATSMQPTSFTELYFADRHALPAHMQADKVYDASFVIANHTKTTQTYRYTVTTQTVSAIAVQPPVTVRLAAGATATQRIHVKTPIPDQTTLVTVVLDGTDQVIRFYALP